MARGASKTAALLLLLSGLGGLIAVSMAWLVAGPLLIAGAGLAWFGRRKRAFGSPMPAAEPKPVPEYTGTTVLARRGARLIDSIRERAGAAGPPRPTWPCGCRAERGGVSPCPPQ